MSDAVKTGADVASSPRSEASWAITGHVAENFSRLYATNTDAILTSGRLRLVGGAVIPARRAISHATFVNGSTAAAGQTHSWVCVVDQALNVLAKSNDITGGWAAFATRTWDLPPYGAGVDTPVYIGLVVVATTMPTPRGIGANSVLVPLAPALAGDSTANLTDPASLGATAAAIAAPASGPGVIPWVSLS